MNMTQIPVANQAVYQTLSQLLQDVFEDDSIVATPELSAADVDGWDSLSNVRLFLAVEQELNVRFSASEIGAIENVGDLVAAIEKKRAK